MQMMLNAAYIQWQMPTVEVPDEIRAEIESLCETLIGTKHDIMTEVFELDEAASDSAAVSALPQVQRIMRWIADTRGEIDRLVRSLQSKAREKPELFLAALLVTESGTNILNASNTAENAAD